MLYDIQKLNSCQELYRIGPMKSVLIFNVRNYTKKKPVQHCMLIFCSKWHQ